MSKSVGAGVAKPLGQRAFGQGALIGPTVSSRNEEHCKHPIVHLVEIDDLPIAYRSGNSPRARVRVGVPSAARLVLS